MCAKIDTQQFGLNFSTLAASESNIVCSNNARPLSVAAGTAMHDDMYRIGDDWKLIDVDLMVKPLPPQNAICRFTRSCGNFVSLFGESDLKRLLWNAPSHYAMELTFLTEDYERLSFVLERVDVGLNFYQGRLPLNEGYVRADRIPGSDITVPAKDIRSWMCRESCESYDFALSNCKHLAYSFFHFLRSKDAVVESFLDFCFKRDDALSPIRSRLLHPSARIEENISGEGVDIQKISDSVQIDHPHTEIASPHSGLLFITKAAAAAAAIAAAAAATILIAIN